MTPPHLPPRKGRPRPRPRPGGGARDGVTGIDEGAGAGLDGPVARGGGATDGGMDLGQVRPERAHVAAAGGAMGKVKIQFEDNEGLPMAERKMGVCPTSGEKN